MKTFEQYLKIEHGMGYTGELEDISTDYKRWLATIEIDVLIQYANDYVDELVRETKKVIDKNYQDIMKILK